MTTPTEALKHYTPLDHEAMTAIHLPGDVVSDTKARMAYARNVEAAVVAYYRAQVSAALAQAEQPAEQAQPERMEMRATVQQAYLALEELQGPGFLIGGVMHYRIGLILPKLNAVVDALAAPPAAQPLTWQPIETAPKDGTEVLLYAPDRRTYGAWAEPSAKPRILYRDGFAPEEEWDEFEPYWASWDGGFTAEHPPTHWMPLPAAPTDSGIGTPAQMESPTLGTAPQGGGAS